MNDSQQNRPLIVICLLLALATAATFWSVIGCEFVNYDDHFYVTANRHVQAGLTGDSIGWAFTHVHASNWHPVTWLSHMLDWELFGSNAAGHHVVNLLFHIANTLLFFLLLERMTGAVWKSAMVAALFALHPLHVESVAWIAERKDVLSTFFWLLTIWSYTRYAEKSAASRYLWVVVFFILALMSKPMVVTLPCLLLLLDFWPLGRTPLSLTLFGRQISLPDFRLNPDSPTALQKQPWTRLLLEKVPLLALAAIASAITVFAQRGTIQPLGHIPVPIRLCNAVYSYSRYLMKMVYPVKLSVHYPYIQVWSLVTLLVCAVVLGWLCFAAIRRARSQPYLFVGWFWFLGTLVPAIGLVQVGEQSMADRYSYVPLVGIFIALVWGVTELAASRNLNLRAVAVVGVLCLIACGIGTRLQLRYWRNSVVLFEHAISLNSHNALAHYNLGVSYLERNHPDKARHHFAEAVRINPRVADSQNNLANLLVAEGKVDEGIEHYQASLALRPNDPSTEFNLGLALSEAARNEDAIVHFQAALRLNPALVAAHKFLGIAFLRQKRLNEALAELSEYTRVAPADPEGRLLLADACSQLGDAESARNNYTAALSIDPQLFEHVLQAAQTQQRPERVDAALILCHPFVRLEPENPNIHTSIGMFLASRGRMRDAITNFSEAVRLRPTAEAHYNLALALATQSDSKGALTQYRKALELKPDWAPVLNDLAWLLATDSSEQIRNGSEAVRLAQRACELVGGKEPRYLGTLDASYAEAGRFDEAIQTARKAQELALASRQQPIADAASQRLRLYEAKTAYRQPQ